MDESPIPVSGCEPAAVTTSAAVIPLPIHAVARDGDGNPVRVGRGPGRPKRVRVAPVADEAAYNAALRAAREAHVEDDAVVRAAELRDGAIDLGWALLRSIARETASIRWEIEQRPSSREAERARSRRIDGLLVIARLRIELHRAEAGELTPRRLHALKRLLLETILAVATECLPEEQLRQLERRVREVWEVGA